MEVALAGFSTLLNFDAMPPPMRVFLHFGVTVLLLTSPICFAENPILELQYQLGHRPQERHAYLKVFDNGMVERRLVFKSWNLQPQREEAPEEVKTLVDRFQLSMSPDSESPFSGIGLNSAIRDFLRNMEWSRPDTKPLAPILNSSESRRINIYIFDDGERVPVYQIEEALDGSRETLTTFWLGEMSIILNFLEINLPRMFSFLSPWAPTAYRINRERPLAELPNLVLDELEGGDVKDSTLKHLVIQQDFPNWFVAIRTAATPPFVSISRKETYGMTAGLRLDFSEAAEVISPQMLLVYSGRPEETVVVPYLEESNMVVPESVDRRSRFDFWLPNHPCFLVLSRLPQYRKPVRPTIPSP